MKRSRRVISIVSLLGMLAAGPVLAAPPANDTCTNATVVPLAGGSYTVNNISEATPDYFEQFDYEFPPGIWYKVNGPASGSQAINLSFNISGSLQNNTGKQAYVFTGSCTEVVEEVSSAATLSNTAPMTLSFTANANTSYYVLLALFSNIEVPADAVGSVVFQPALPPANDTCAGAVDVTGTSFTHTASNWALSTNDSVSVTCDTPSPGHVRHGLWYKYTAPSTPHGSSRVTVTTNSGGMLITAFRGSCGSLVPQSRYDNPASTCLVTSTGFEYYTFNALDNTTYYILAGIPSSETYELSANTNQTINVISDPLPPVPANDTCGTARVISSLDSPFTQSVSLGGAGHDVVAAGTTVHNGVWWQYTPSVNEYINFAINMTSNGNTIYNQIDYQIAIGTSCGGLTLMNPGLGDGIRLYAGTTYRFIVGYVYTPTNLPVVNAVANITVTSLGPTPPAPSNDLCANAKIIPSLPYTDSVVIGGAGDDAGIPCAFSGLGRRGIWYSYTPPITQAILVERASGSGPVALYEGGCSNLIMCEQGAFSTVVEAGVPLRIFAAHDLNYFLPNPNASGKPNDVSTVRVRGITPMTNDDCTDALEITEFPTNILVNNAAAASEPPATLRCPGDPNSTIEDQIVNSIYFSVTAPSDGELKITKHSCCTFMRLFTGTCEERCILQRSDSYFGVHTFVQDVEAGTTYRVVVGRGNPGSVVNDLTFEFTPSVPACPADFNGDDARDVADLFAYINAWLAKTANADFNDDNSVDVADLFAYINAWLAGC